MDRAILSIVFYDGKVVDFFGDDSVEYSVYFDKDFVEIYKKKDGGRNIVRAVRSDCIREIVWNEKKEANMGGKND